MWALLLFCLTTVNCTNQFGPLLQPFIPIGPRLSGFPISFPGVNRNGKKYLVFPQDSAATYSESQNRCKGLGAELAILNGPDDLESLGCLLNSAAFVGKWSLSRLPEREKNCLVLAPGGSLAGIISWSFSHYRI